HSRHRLHPEAQRISARRGFATLGLVGDAADSHPACGGYGRQAPTAVRSLDRRDFLKVAGVGTGAVLAGCASAPGFLRAGRASSNIVVVGAGAFGGWTALNLQRMGARVTLVDMFGPGNSRATSGDETRGVRSSYGDRPHGELW